MKLSYLVTTHNETESLRKCLNNIRTYRDEGDEIVVLDDFSDDPMTQSITTELQLNTKDVKVVKHALSKDYGAHKNFGNQQTSGNWIFQIDGDEIPNPNLIINLKAFIGANPQVELWCVPRINDQRGVTEGDAREFGWRLVYHPDYEDGKIPVISWPDYQTRIYKNEPKKIYWVNRLHERIVGANNPTALPADFDLSLFHDKTIEKTRETNRRYHKTFEATENMGTV
jgi:glycosyltransferase involved in cell wall biosynthesis